MDITCLLEKETKYGGIYFRHIQGNVKSRHLLVFYVTSRNYFPVDGMLVIIT